MLSSHVVAANPMRPSGAGLANYSRANRIIGKAHIGTVAGEKAGIGDICLGAMHYRTPFGRLPAQS
jgi:hypothetical protein